ncbi:MAG TPA: hypothetical protein VK200_08820, partial [Candidatus Limnocylindrales bacterium]|nr:hypothetical protein [Candidatus Limnocylindrales bacterium]
LVIYHGVRITAAGGLYRLGLALFDLDSPGLCLTAFVADVRGANLGISINISAPIDAAERCCHETGITRHSVEYSLGFCGRVDRLPNATTLELSTMCGHGMLSANFAMKMIDWVKENRRSPEQAARYMARFCICGVFNIKRAQGIIEKACNLTGQNRSGD